MDWFESAKELLKKWKSQQSQFTPRVQQVFGLARKEAERFNHNYLGTEHLLLGLIKLGQGVAVNVLVGMGVSLETVRMEVEKQTGIGPDQKMTGNIPYTPRVKKVLDLARREAKALHHKYIGTEHLLLGLLQEGDGIGAQVLRNLDVDIKEARQRVLKELDPNFDAVRFSSILAEETLVKQKIQKLLSGDPTQFTPRAQQVLALARQESERLHLNYLGTEHLLWGLIKLGGGVATHLLVGHGMNLENVRKEIEEHARGHAIKMTGNIPYTPRMTRVLTLAKEEAKALNHTYIGTEHLLLGLLHEKEGPAAEIFKSFNVDTEKMRAAILKEINPK